MKIKFGFDREFQIEDASITDVSKIAAAAVGYGAAIFAEYGHTECARDWAMMAAYFSGVVTGDHNNDDSVSALNSILYVGRRELLPNAPARKTLSGTTRL